MASVVKYFSKELHFRLFNWFRLSLCNSMIKVNNDHTKAATGGVL